MSGQGWVERQMAYIPTVRILADPTKHARLWRVLEPMFNSRLLRERHQSENAKKMTGTTVRWAQDERIVGALKIYNIYHSLLAQNLSRLADKRIIFTTGNSIDFTDPACGFKPKRSGLDYAAESSKLSTEIANVVKYLNHKFGWDMFDDLHFIYMNHVICPFHVTRDFRLAHSLEDIVEQTNQTAAQLGISARFGDTIKNPGNERFKQGISFFRDTLVDSSRAKEVDGGKTGRLVEIFNYDPDDKRLRSSDRKYLIRLFKTKENIASTTSRDIELAFERDCYFNRLVMANAYLSVVEQCSIAKPMIYAARGDFANDIFDIVSRLYLQKHGKKLVIDKFGEQKGIMKNTKQSLLGECDPSALDRLAGKLKSLWAEKTGRQAIKIQDAQLKNYLVPASRTIPPGGKIECCSALPFLRCSQKQDCDSKREQTGKRLEKCAVDFARNNFTREDVAKMLAAREGNVNLSKLNETYEQLRFKTLKVKGFDRPVSELELLQDDCNKQGYSFGFVELDNKLLNFGKDERIYEINENGLHEGRSWVGFKQQLEAKILPLKINEQPQKEWQVRASQFANSCHIARILAKIDEQKLANEEEILPNKYSIIGIVRHRLSDQRPWADYLREAAKEQLPIWDYCEREIFCEIANKNRQKGEPDRLVVSGHGDAFFLMTNSKPEQDMVVVTDYKRGKKGAYEKPAYIMQGMIYAKGAEAAAGREFAGGAIVNLIKRFFHGEEGGDSFPEYYLGRATPQSYDSIKLQEVDFGQKRIIAAQGVEQIVSSSYRTEKLLLGSRQALANYALLARELKLCYDSEMPKEFRQCFNKDACALIRRLAAKGQDVRKYFLDGVVV